jgi:hypothetical protein
VISQERKFERQDIDLSKAVQSLEEAYEAFVDIKK